jgi:hypothetical protein
MTNNNSNYDMWSDVKKLFWVGVVFVAFMGAFLISMAVWNRSDRSQGQYNAAYDVCKYLEINQEKDGSLESNAKIVIVEREGTWGAKLSPFHAVLPDERKAETAEEIGGIVCLFPNRFQADTASYNEIGESGPEIYTCKVYQTDINAFLVDNTGALIDQQLFPGGNPGTFVCPPTTYSDIEVEGRYPEAEPIIEWVLNR